MTRYLISFDDGAMTFPEEDVPAVGEAAHAVVKAAQEAGVWIFGGGVASQRASIVATDGTITDGPYPETKARRRCGRSCSTRSSDRGNGHRSPTARVPRPRPARARH
jgi:hypothetical protein